MFLHISSEGSRDVILDRVGSFVEEKLRFVQVYGIRAASSLGLTEV